MTEVFSYGEWPTPLGEIAPTEQIVVGLRYYERYWLAMDLDNELEHEVTQEQFAKAERSAGFYPRHGCGPVATGGFSNGVIRGRVESLFPRKDTDV